jgi:hypothetical protein
MPIIKVDTEKVAVLSEKGGKFFFEANAEDALVQLLEIEAAVADAIKQAKDAIVAAGSAVTPDFSGVQSDRLRSNYSYHGALYSVKGDEASSEFMVKKVTYSPNKDEIEKFADINGMLPVGVYKNERTKSMTLTIKKPKALKAANVEG